MLAVDLGKWQRLATGNSIQIMPKDISSSVEFDDDYENYKRAFGKYMTQQDFQQHVRAINSDMLRAGPSKSAGLTAVLCMTCTCTISFCWLLQKRKQQVAAAEQAVVRCNQTLSNVNGPSRGARFDLVQGGNILELWITFPDDKPVEKNVFSLHIYDERMEDGDDGDEADEDPAEGKGVDAPQHEEEPEGHGEGSVKTKAVEQRSAPAPAIGNTTKTYGALADTGHGDEDGSASQSYQKLEENVFCRKCGSSIPGDSVFCHKCGTKRV